MTVTFDSTISGDKANSFASLQQILDYFETTNTLKFDEWKVLSVKVKEIFAIAATAIIVDHFHFDLWDGPTVIQIKDADGNITTERQNLPWPQLFVPLNGVYEIRQLNHRHHSSTISNHSFRDDQQQFEHLSFLRSFGAGIQTHKPLEFFNDNEIPPAIIEGQAELALILKRLDEDDIDIFAVPEGQNIILEKVGVITTQFSNPTEFFNIAEGIIKAEAWIKLQKFGRYIPNINTPGYKSPGIIA